MYPLGTHFITVINNYSKLTYPPRFGGELGLAFRQNGEYLLTLTYNRPSQKIACRDFFPWTESLLKTFMNRHRRRTLHW